MAKKSQVKSQVKSAESEESTLAIGTGVTLFSRGRGASEVPAPTSRIKITVLTDIRDLKEGRAETVPIWGETANMEFVSDELVDVIVRQEVTDFFVRRAIAPVLEKLIIPPFVKPSETAVTKPMFYDALTGSGCSDRAAQVIMELLIGPFAKLGFLSGNGKFARQERFPFRRVTAAQISHEVAVHQMENALGNVSLSGVDPTQKQSKHVFAERIAEAFRPVGLSLLQAAELSSVVDDIVVGVRAHIAPYGISADDVDAVPSSWRNNAQIAELASCLPFVRAALIIPAGTPLALKNEGSNLDSWLRVIINYLRDSKRYKWISRKEALRHYTTKKIRNVKGEVVSVVAHRSLKAVPQAQAVIAIKDGAVMNLDAVNISATKDRIAEVVQSTYGSADFSTNAGAELYASIASDLISLGYVNASQAVFIDAVGDGATMYDIAALIATSLEVEIGADGNIVTSEDVALESRATGADKNEATWDPRWWFSVASRERNLEVIAGRHYGDVVVTPDPVEALMAADELVAEDVYPAQPQLMSQAAFNSRVINFDSNDLQPIDEKFTFEIAYAGRNLKGAFRAMDFASLRAARLTTLVRPHFNDAVVRALSDAYSATDALITEAGGADRDAFLTNQVATDVVINSMHRRVAIQLLRMAQQLSPTFRRDVHRAMIERVVIANSDNSEELAITRAQLMQSAFAAMADVTSLLFFLFIQGIECEAFVQLAASETMQAVCLEMGSDRKEDAVL